MPKMNAKINNNGMLYFHKELNNLSYDNLIVC